LKDGTIFDSSKRRDFLEFTIGNGFLISTFEREIIGLAEGESIIIAVPAEEVFGSMRKKVIEKIPQEQLPNDLILGVGKRLQMTTSP
jgi:peptidylprolyl isomerase